MAEYTELNQNVSMRKRIPLRDAFIEAFPEHTPIITALPKKSGQKTTSPESSEVEWPFKTFREGRNRPVFDGTDVTSDEYEDNDSNKAMIKGRLQLIRSAAGVGRIAEAVVEQHGGVKSKYKDNMKDCLRGMRTDKELIVSSEADSKAQASGPPKVAYQTRGFVSWGRDGAHADLPIPEMARMPAGQRKAIAAAADFSEADLNDMLETCFNTRKVPGNWHMFGTSGLQRAVDNFTCFGDVTEELVPIRRYNSDASTGHIKIGVKSYSGTFGKVAFTPKVGLPTAFTLAGSTTANASPTVTVTSNAKLFAGMPVSGAGIPAGTRILSVPTNSTTSITLTANATASATVTLTFGETVFAELWDFDYAELGYVDEVGWVNLENKGGGPRGYADCLFFLANLNPQAHALVMKS